MKRTLLVILGVALVHGIAVAQDYVPPPALTGVIGTPGVNKVFLTFTAPGDACTNAQCAEYSIRYSAQPTITNLNFVFQNALGTGTWAPAAPGTAECIDSAVDLQGSLNCGTTYYVAMKVKDSAGNWSSISNAISFTTRPCLTQELPPCEPVKPARTSSTWSQIRTLYR